MLRDRLSMPVFWSRIGIWALGLCFFAYSESQAAKVVRFDTDLGTFDVELFEADAPLTVANFLDNYVLLGEYDGSIIHRRAQAATSGVDVIQGGGYTFDFGANTIGDVPSAGNVDNEFDPAHSNLRGTIAMARPPGGIDTASKEWFINLEDANSVLDLQSFTVFGEVISGMDVVDAIAALDIFDATFFHPAFTDLPLENGGVNAMGNNLGPDLVIVNSVTLLPTPSPPAVPEPAAVVLSAMSLLGFLAYAWRRRRRAT